MDLRQTSDKRLYCFTVKDAGNSIGSTSTACSAPHHIASGGQRSPRTLPRTQRQSTRQLQSPPALGAEERLQQRRQSASDGVEERGRAAVDRVGVECYQCPRLTVTSCRVAVAWIQAHRRPQLQHPSHGDLHMTGDVEGASKGPSSRR